MTDGQLMEPDIIQIWRLISRKTLASLWKYHQGLLAHSVFFNGNGTEVSSCNHELVTLSNI